MTACEDFGCCCKRKCAPIHRSAHLLADFCCFLGRCDLLRVHFGAPGSAARQRASSGGCLATLGHPLGGRARAASTDRPAFRGRRRLVELPRHLPPPARAGDSRRSIWLTARAGLCFHQPDRPAAKRRRPGSSTCSAPCRSPTASYGWPTTAEPVAGAGGRDALPDHRGGDGLHAPGCGDGFPDDRSVEDHREEAADPVHPVDARRSLVPPARS